jgi:hypothetical protein
MTLGGCVVHEVADVEYDPGLSGFLGCFTVT